MEDTLYGVILGFILGFILGWIVFHDSYHGDLCQERFSHAETTVDSLTIIQVDNFCFKLIMEQK